MSAKHYAVVGCPISHSLSPFIHSELFILDNIDAIYTPLHVENLDADYDTKLKALDGYNVTIPYKLDIIKKLDIVSDKAKLAGSVNTVKNGELSQGYTTDGYGFVSAVKAKTGDTLPKDVLIYGYGGAARAIAYECIDNGCNVSFVVREKSLFLGKALADEIQQKLGVTATIYTADTVNDVQSIGLLVNATPVGMYPNIDACIASDEIIKKADAVFDAVYNPLETVLLKKAKEYGKCAIGSIDMLVYQAAKAHEIWVGATYTDEQLQKICRKTEDMLR